MYSRIESDAMVDGVLIVRLVIKTLGILVHEASHEVARWWKLWP